MRTVSSWALYLMSFVLFVHDIAATQLFEVIVDLAASMQCVAF
jgi:hypothetical protein